MNYNIIIDDDPCVGPAIESALGLRSEAYLSFDDFVQKPLPSHSPAGVFIHFRPGNVKQGHQAVSTMRNHWTYVPIIVLVTGTDDELLNHALTAGANDFLRKPIDRCELSARFRMRCDELFEKSCKDIVNFSDISLNLQFNQLMGPTGTVDVTRSSVRLLLSLVQMQGNIVSRSDLKRKMWGNQCISDNALDKRIHEVRKSLRAVGSTINLASEYRKGFSLLGGAATED